jgi:RNA polymerase sigma-70 factor (ECF subfamily)
MPCAISEMKDPKKLTALELLQLCLNSNDPDAWNEFVSRFQPLIARVVIKAVRNHTRILPTPDLVEDLVQDTFVKLFSNNCRALRAFHFEHENSFYGFLKVVAINVVQDWWRAYLTDKRGGGRQLVDLDEARSVHSAANPQKDRERRAFYEMIRCRLSMLKNEPNFARDVAIFWLYYWHGFTAKEITELPGIGLGVKGVESTIFRLIKFLRGGFGDAMSG